MNLKINGWKKILKWGGLGLLLVLFLVFFIKTAVWEHQYYTEKEGSERSETVATEDEELIEEKPSDDEIAEYVVAPERPRYLTIERLGISNARIIPMGINSKGELSTPNTIFDVGWYEASGLPGKGETMVIDGHNGGPNVYGIFKELPILEKGDLVIVERGDGVKFTFSVVENVTVPLSEADDYMSTAMRSPVVGKESVTLITCTGEWSQAQGTYLSRQFTRAVLVN